MGMLISCPTLPGIEMNTCTYMHAHTHIHTYVNSQLTCVLSHLNLISTSLWSLSNTVWLAPNSEGSNQSMLLFSGNCNFMCVVSLTSHMGITGASIYILMRIWGFLEKNHWLETLQLKYSVTSSTDVSDAAFCIFNRRLLIVSHLECYRRNRCSFLSLCRSSLGNVSRQKAYMWTWRYWILLINRAWLTYSSYKFIPL